MGNFMLAMLGNYCYDSSQLVSIFGDIGTDPFKKDRSIVSQAIINFIRNLSEHLICKSQFSGLV
jgi:hypothetical protein